MDELTDRLRETLQEYCRLATMPVAIKLMKGGDEPKQKAKYPLDHLCHRMAVCQGMTVARSIGWTMALFQIRPFDRRFELRAEQRG